MIAFLQVYVCASRGARARRAVPRAPIGMRQFSAPARESCDTPGCSLLYGHAGVHFFARNRRPPDVLDPAAQPAGPSVRQPVTAARLAASTQTWSTLCPAFSLEWPHENLRIVSCALPGPLTEAAAARVRKDLKRPHDAPTCASCADEAAVSSRRPAGKRVAAAPSSEAPFALPAGSRVAPPPPDEQLEFGRLGFGVRGRG